VIVSDLSLLEYAKSISLPAHVSVQMNVANFESVKFLAKFADVIVLARELSLTQIAKIASSIKKQNILSPSGSPVKLEVFVHGALCVAVSGTCGMSLSSYGKSAFRGECYQNCRRKYRVFDDETGEEFVVDNNYVMSPKDLCCIKILDKIIEAGVSILKIEGRGRSPDYVYETTKAYREARDKIVSGKFTAKFAENLEKRLGSVFNRGFWTGGYYLGDRSGEWSGISGGKAEKKKIFAGRVTNYFQKAGCAEASLQSEGLKINDEVLITGATTGVLKFKIKSLRINDVLAKFANKGDMGVTFLVPDKIRRGDKIFLLQ
jgi:putative protease